MGGAYGALVVDFVSCVACSYCGHCVQVKANMVDSFLNFLVVTVLALQALSFVYANATKERGLKVKALSISGVIVNALCYCKTPKNKQLKIKRLKVMSRYQPHPTSSKNPFSTDFG